MSGALTHSPADILRRALVSLGVGVLPEDGGDWPISATVEPNKPDNSITLYNTTSIKQGRSQLNGEIQEQYGIQVRVRSAGTVAGYTKANEVVIALDQSIRLTTVTINSSVYLIYGVSRLGGVIDLGKETPTSKRNLSTINATVTLRQTT